MPEPGASRPGPAPFAALLLAAASALRLAFVFLGPGPGFTPTGDQVDYHALAAHLAAGLGYVLPGGDGTLYATAFRPPLYPALLAVAYALAGSEPIVGLVVTALLGALLPVALWALGRRLFDESAGRLAGIVAALYPLLVFFSGQLLTETLYALLLVVAAFAVARWWRTGGLVAALLAGSAVGVAALARPTAPAWLALLVAAGFVLAPRPRRRWALEACALALGGALVIGPWTIRNAIALDAFVPLTTGGGAALYDGNNRYVIENPELHGAAWSLRSVEPYASEFRGLGEVEIDRLSMRRAWEFWREHPGRLPQLVLWKEARYWRPRAQAGRTAGWWIDPGSPFARLASRLDPLALSYGVLLPFFLWGAWRTLRRPREPAFVLLAAILAQAGLAALYWGSLRFRMPVEPFLILLAAGGIVDLGRRAAVRFGLGRPARGARAGS